MPSVTTTAVHSRRNSFDLMSKQAEHMELSTKEAAREMEIKLQNQIRMNLARRLGEIEPAETPPTLVGSPRASFDSKDKNGWHDDLEKPTSQEHLEDGPPDGGFRAWLVVSGTFLMSMYTNVQYVHILDGRMTDHRCTPCSSHDQLWPPNIVRRIPILLPQPSALQSIPIDSLVDWVYPNFLHLPWLFRVWQALR